MGLHRAGPGAWFARGGPGRAWKGEMGQLQVHVSETKPGFCRVRAGLATQEASILSRQESWV